MPETMKAVVPTKSGASLRDIAVPEPSAGEILVRVHAAGVNRADVSLAKIPGPDGEAPKALGMEWAGEIIALGSGVTTWAVGDRVACWNRSGGYAEFATCDARCAFPLTAAMSFVDGAILPLVQMTAHNALTVGRFRPGDRVFVNGASSGVGLATMAIARLLGATRIIAGSTSPAKESRLLAAGADDVIDTRAAGWSSLALETTDGVGADVVVDMVSGPEFDETMRATAIGGNIVNVGRLGGQVSPINMDLHALRRIGIHGVTFRSRSMDDIAAIVAGLTRDVWPHIGGKMAPPPLEASFLLSSAEQALALMAANQHFGKIALLPSGEEV